MTTATPEYIKCTAGGVHQWTFRRTPTRSVYLCTKCGVQVDKRQLKEVTDA